MLYQNYRLLEYIIQNYLGNYIHVDTATPNDKNYVNQQQ